MVDAGGMLWLGCPRRWRTSSPLQSSSTAPGGLRLSYRRVSYTVKVYKGFEYRVGTSEFSVSADQAAHCQVTMERWVNMPDRGWLQRRRPFAHSPVRSGAESLHFPGNAGRRYPRRQPLAIWSGAPVPPTRSNTPLDPAAFTGRATTYWPGARRTRGPTSSDTPLFWAPILQSISRTSIWSTGCSGSKPSSNTGWSDTPILVIGFLATSAALTVCRSSCPTVC